MGRLVAFAMCLFGCGDAGTFTSNCTVGPAMAEASLTAGRKPDGSVILPGGRKDLAGGALVVDDRDQTHRSMAARTLKDKLLITHRFTLDKIFDAYETFGHAAATRTLKVIVAA